jgi:hypothetical protein
MEAFGFISNGRLAARSATNRVYMDICWRSKMTQFRELGGEDALAAAMNEKWSERSDFWTFAARRGCATAIFTPAISLPRGTNLDGA